MEHCVRKYNLNSATSLSISVRVDLTAFGALEHLLRGIDWGQNLTSLEFYFEGCCCRSMETKTLADSIWPEIKTKALIEVHCSTKWCPKKGGWFEEAEASRLELLGLEHLIGPPEEAAASEDNGTTESQDSIANEVQMVERGQ
ncbi:hypothetical protein K461DRAFT_280454 [Myriangium duriaei CBS 260.36]|uniref:Uncharacterized protein n=1 Tax=Myriangium duriaei CBS 260.36 TaxID=1168546 RepID=A0A9P4MHY2_9PEZI|nr:hypothetical protein K461DRAFT_280454 [Myriangium duriaei CBS 260.36]